MSENRPKTGPKPPDDPDDERDDASAEMVAYLDGELDPKSAAAIEAKISLDPAARAEADALKRTWELLDYLPLPEPSPNFTQRTLSGTDLNGNAKQVAAAERTRAAKSVSQGASAGPAPQRGKSKAREIALVACWFFALAAAFAGGYLIRDRYAKQLQNDRRTHINAEKRLLNNLPRYRFIESKSNLKTLDDPELFGEE